MGDIVFSGVTKRYGDVTAVRSLDLDVADGELLVLLGPSGCGKTTALRMVAGLEEVTEWTISIGGAVANDVAPKDRDVAMVFQTYALYPHLSVERNIEFPLTSAASIAKRGPGGCTRPRPPSASTPTSTASRESFREANASGWLSHVRSCAPPRPS